VLGAILRSFSPAAVAGVGIACQRSTCLFWDAQSGRPLTRALSWQDRRGEAICRDLARHAPSIARKTGLRLSPHYAASKIRWLLDRFPGLRRFTRNGRARFGTLDSYLLFRLTGGASWSTDPTHAARTLLMNLKHLDWDPELLDLFGELGAVGRDLGGAEHPGETVGQRPEPRLHQRLDFFQGDGLIAHRKKPPRKGARP
jgi:glycerol kinase